MIHRRIRHCNWMCEKNQAHVVANPVNSTSWGLTKNISQARVHINRRLWQCNGHIHRCICVPQMHFGRGLKRTTLNGFDTRKLFYLCVYRKDLVRHMGSDELIWFFSVIELVVDLNSDSIIFYRNKLYMYVILNINYYKMYLLCLLLIF